MSQLPQTRQPDVEANRLARFRLKTLWMQDETAKVDIYNRIKGDPENVESVIQGFFFWVDHFAWYHDEYKPPKLRIGPCILWSFQREIARVIITNVFRCLYSNVDEWNAYGEKGRRTAWTFLNLLIIQYLWQFHGISTALTSKTLEETDKRGDMNTPFAKLRFQIELQPKWLMPPKFDMDDEECYKICLIAIPGGGAQIAGIKPDGSGMRQARALIYFGDEFPHTKTASQLWDAACGTTKVRIVGGTPSDPATKAYRIRFNKDGENAHIFVIDWWQIPEYAEGLERLPDGTWTSPWMENQKANKSRQTIAKEYLMDWDDAAGGRYFHMFRQENCVPGLEVLKYAGNEKAQLFRIWDPGLHFAVLWAQVDEHGTLRYLRELVLNDEQVTSDTLLNKMARESLRITAEEFPKELEVIDLGDPYASRKQLSSQEKTEYELLYERFKIRVLSAYMFAIPAHERRDRRNKLLADKMSFDVEKTGKPALLIDPHKCPTLLEAFKTGYRRVVLDTGEITDEIARNHPFNDVVDCAGMFALKVHAHTTKGGGVKVAKKKVSWKRTGRSSLYG